MTLISIVEAAKDFGIKPIFQNLNLHINEGERLGLIGPNGSGKSTLLKVLAGLEPLKSGHIKYSPYLRMELVGQDTVVKPGRTVLEEVLAGCGEKRELLFRFNSLTNAIAKSPKDSKILSELGELSQRMDEAEAWSLEQQCKEILQRLGISELQRPIEQLSGGYRKRVALASALVSKPDLLLLDEPTNHLDAISVEWLQSWLDKYRGALVLVTHDRYVLDRITKRMIEINHGKATYYQGNYSDFLNQKTQKEEEELSSLSKFKGILKKELAWLKQGPKARSTKQKARIQRIERMQESPKKIKESSLEMNSLSRRIGKLVIEAESLRVTTTGNKDSPLLFDNFTYQFTSEDRVGIIGPNGSGKSTLLDLIAGKKQPNSGFLRIGETVHIGYLDQQTEKLLQSIDQNRKVIDFVEEEASQINLGDEQITASQLLERFLFPPSQQHSPLKLLSGGEKRRLTLCKMLIKSPNVLLLDEPTNDLDIQTLRILEDFLENFKGCVVIVSHDRYFLDRTVDRIFSIEDGLLRRFEGNYTAFIERKQIEEKELARISSTSNKDKGPILKKNKKKLHIESKNHKPKSIQISNKPRKRSFKESQELKELDHELPLLEAERKKIEEAISLETHDLTKLSKQLAEIIEKIHSSENRWLELSELSS